MDSEILETVRVYAEALSRGDFARAASCIDPQDRVDFQRELLASLALLEEVGFDYGIGAQFQNQPVEALSRLSAEEFLALFLAQSERHSCRRSEDGGCGGVGKWMTATRW